ncbi:MAG: aldose 1-epimerase family protein [Ilyomonas sp.]
MLQIANEILTVEIATKGAELQSVFNRKTGLEYMWSAEEVWPKKSPVLFPIVGGLKNNTYQYKGKTYQLGRHGFARDKDFFVQDQSENAVVFAINDSTETIAVYPFQFNFFIRYSIDGNKLAVEYTVINKDDEVMHFSVGAHPAFKVPLVEGTSFEDYFLAFDTIENSERWLLSGEGLIEDKTVAVFNNTQKLPLQKSLFYEDALVFKDLESTNISLQSDRTSNGLTMSFEGFPYLGIWSKKDADFICIEPWCGIADSVHASGQLQEKEGILSLQPNGIFTKKLEISFF